jgi:hypothetical protein
LDNDETRNTAMKLFSSTKCYPRASSMKPIWSHTAPSSPFRDRAVDEVVLALSLRRFAAHVLEFSAEIVQQIAVRLHGQCDRFRTVDTYSEAMFAVGILMMMMSEGGQGALAGPRWWRKVRRSRKKMDSRYSEGAML